MPVVEDRGAAGSHVWFESSVRLKLRNEWRFNAWGGAMGASGGSCVSLTHDELSDEQRTALEGLLLVPLNAGCPSDGYDYDELTVVDRDGSEAVYRNTGCEYLKVPGALAMLPQTVPISGGTPCTE